MHGIGDQIGSIATIREIVNRLGGSSAIENFFIAIGFSLLAVAAAALGISAQPHIAFAVFGSAAAILAAPVMTGLSYGIAADKVDWKLRTVLPLRSRNRRFGSSSRDRGRISALAARSRAVWPHAASSVRTHPRSCRGHGS